MSCTSAVGLVVVWTRVPCDRFKALYLTHAHFQIPIIPWRNGTVLRPHENFARVPFHLKSFPKSYKNNEIRGKNILLDEQSFHSTMQRDQYRPFFKSKNALQYYICRYFSEPNRTQYSTALLCCITSKIQNQKPKWRFVHLLNKRISHCKAVLRFILTLLEAQESYFHFWIILFM